MFVCVGGVWVCVCVFGGEEGEVGEVRESEEGEVRESVSKILPFTMVFEAYGKFKQSHRELYQ